VTVWYLVARTDSGGEVTFYGPHRKRYMSETLLRLAAEARPDEQFRIVEVAPDAILIEELEESA
jgi:hypothetical protein